MGSVQFDGTEILNSTYLPQFVKHESAADRSLDTMPIAREDGEVLIAEWYGKKVITLQGMLIGTSESDLETKIDSFKELFSRPERNLDLSWAGGTRRYVATCTKHQFDRDHYHINAVPWTAEFTVAAGQGKDTSTTTAVSAESLTTSDGTVSGDFIATSSFTLEGSKPPRPLITLEISSADAAMNGIEYTNLDTGERIIITSALDWSALSGKQIKIDCENRRVTTNFAGATFEETPFFGVIPTFRIGTNNIQIRSGGIVNQRSSEESVPFGAAGNFLPLSTTNFGAFSFVVPYSADTFRAIALGLAHTGSNPLGNFFWRIVADAGGMPDYGGSSIASGTLSPSAVSVYPTYSYNILSNASVFALVADTRYWFLFGSQSDPVAGSQQYVVNFDGGILYPRGGASTSIDTGSTWSPSSSMFPFRLYFAGQGKATDLLHTVEYTKTYL